MIFEKAKTLGWFISRPAFWAQARELSYRKLLPDLDTAENAKGAEQRAKNLAVPVVDALAKVGLLKAGLGLPVLASSILDEAHVRARSSRVEMGGPGDLNLLYAATICFGDFRVVETGVAYGWSSLAILAALHGRPDARLVSVDMPYPKQNNEAWVGVVVPNQFRSQWQLIREPDRNGLKKAIAKFGGVIDLCHYDSDKSYRGREYAYEIIWNALRPGGVFISDDIQDNFSFKEFVEAKRLDFGITEFQGKYVGIVRKPDIQS